MTVSSSERNLPNYGQLVRFLFQPFVSDRETLKVDCELMTERAKIWVRVAFPEPDRGTVFGRAGRNVYAIRAVLDAVAAAVGQTVNLDVYGSGSHLFEGERFRAAEDSAYQGGERPHRSSSRRPPRGDGRSGGERGGGDRRRGGSGGRGGERRYRPS